MGVKLQADAGLGVKQQDMQVEPGVTVGVNHELAHVAIING